MQTTTHDAGHGLRNPLADPDPSTQPRNNQAARTIGFGLGALLGPVAVGAGLATFRGSWRAGLVAGGATALAVGLLRWQLARWFTAEPAYEVEQVIGDIEIRRYAPRVEAHTRLATADYDNARVRGFHRLADYIFGSNADRRELAMTSPVLIMPRGSAHTVAFVMPPGQHHSELPHPLDARVELVDVPARRVAVLRYHGRDRAVARRVDELRARVIEAGLTALREPIVAAFDPPWTLPFLRRTEIWLEVV